MLYTVQTVFQDRFKIIWTGSTRLQQKHVLLDHVFVHQVQGSVSDELVEVPVVVLPRLSVARPAARNKHFLVYSFADPLTFWYGSRSADPCL